MITEILKVDPASPEPSDIKKIVAVLKKGGIVALPTETVYGLAVNARDKNALDRLYSVKKRDETKPFTIQISNFSQLKSYVNKLSPALEIILNEFWPGPLTVIVDGKKGRVGLRMPDSKATLYIIEKAGVPLAVTSANISGKAPALSAGDVINIFDGLINLVVDDQTVSGGIESTVLDCTTGSFNIVRKGAVSERLERFLRIYE